MASQWYSLITRKLFLAKTLLAQPDNVKTAEQQDNPAARQEALAQGAIELALRSRLLLLTFIASCHQHKSEKPESLAALQALFAYEVPEIRDLMQLSETQGSWWQHLDQLEAAASRPPATRKTVTDENIIAIAEDQGPDSSPEALLTSINAMAGFAQTIEEQHGEW